MENELMSTREAAALLQVTDRRIRQMIGKGVLPFRRIGGIAVLAREDVERMRDRPKVGRPVILPPDKRRKSNVK